MIAGSPDTAFCVIPHITTLPLPTAPQRVLCHGPRGSAYGKRPQLRVWPYLVSSAANVPCSTGMAGHARSGRWKRKWKWACVRAITEWHLSPEVLTGTVITARRIEFQKLVFAARGKHYIGFRLYKVRRPAGLTSEVSGLIEWLQKLQIQVTGCDACIA